MKIILQSESRLFINFDSKPTDIQNKRCFSLKMIRRHNFDGTNHGCNNGIVDKQVKQNQFLLIASAINGLVVELQY